MGTTFLERHILAALTFAPADVVFVLSLALLTTLKIILQKSTSYEAAKRRPCLWRAAVALTWMSVVLAVAAAAAVVDSTSFLQYVTTMSSTFTFSMLVGRPLQVFQWVVFALSALYGFVTSSIFKLTNGSAQWTGSKQLSERTPGRLPPSPPPPPLPPGPD